MTYKILVYSKNPAMVTDFIFHSKVFFKTISTTDNLQDVLRHFECFQPDAFVCFMNDANEKILSIIRGLHEERVYNDAAIFVVADAEAGDAIESKAGLFINSIIRRPVSFDNLTLQIIRYFEELKKAEESAKAYERVMKARQAEIEAKEEEIKAQQAKEAREEFIAAAAARRAALLSKERKHILVVDDDRTILKMLKDALQDKYDVTAMANGIMVEKLLDTKNVDLIILDYEMPVETGADVFRKIKKNPKNENIPVCFLTGVSEREKILEVMSLKPHGYLLKPIDMNMLMSTIKNLIG